MTNIKGKKVYVVEIIEKAFSEDITFKKGHPIMWREGMVGVIPVFEDENSAKKSYPDSDIVLYKVN